MSPQDELRLVETWRYYTRPQTLPVVKKSMHDLVWLRASEQLQPNEILALLWRATHHLTQRSASLSNHLRNSIAATIAGPTAQDGVQLGRQRGRMLPAVCRGEAESGRSHLVLGGEGLHTKVCGCAFACTVCRILLHIPSLQHKLRRLHNHSSNDVNIHVPANERFRLSSRYASLSPFAVALRPNTDNS
jgi:hypothetical protein